jgi:hypothetical protein
MHKALKPLSRISSATSTLGEIVVQAPLIDLGCDFAEGLLIRICTGAEINGKVSLEGLSVAEGHLLNRCLGGRRRDFCLENAAALRTGQSDSPWPSSMSIASSDWCRRRRLPERLRRNRIVALGRS